MAKSRQINALKSSCVPCFFFYIMVVVPWVLNRGMDETANIQDIHVVYLKLTFRWHADKQQQHNHHVEDASTIFQQIMHAYEIFSDPL
ncbi:hypothetical protein GOP47_0023991 [Adiantum capillus-veneris]|uniref:J domain-containing protein n=1 Tax=Adiantum capillus-veneris TaxID=13818 RepID=A0A9D4U735_ADICA|nr:hypothetical protein GOP47_0023991 [Adiantum capillus-veneris]